MNNDYEGCDWQETYKAMGCELPYEEDNKEDCEHDEIDDYNELIQAADEIKIPLNPPHPAPTSPYIPDYSQETAIDICEASVILFGQ